MHPFWRFGPTALGAALACALFASTFLPLFTAWLIAINLAAVLLFRYDKLVAGSARTRVPELTLLLIEAVGGTFGAAVAMWLMRPRHKTRSADFLIRFGLVFTVQLAVLAAYLIHFGNF